MDISEYWLSLSKSERGTRQRRQQQYEQMQQAWQTTTAASTANAAYAAYLMKMQRSSAVQQGTTQMQAALYGGVGASSYIWSGIPEQQEPPKKSLLASLREEITAWHGDILRAA